MNHFRQSKAALVELRFPLIAALVLVIFVLLGAGGSFGLRKTVAQLCMPTGVLWVAGFMLLFWPRMPTAGRVLAFALWTGYSLAGSPHVGNALIRKLEVPMAVHEAVDAPLDVLIVLGGGTWERPSGAASLGKGGDRLYRPLQLWHEGKVKRLIPTGLDATNAAGPRSLAEDAKALWVSAGMPTSAIETISGARTTSEELRSLASIYADQWQGLRVGICSSAYHLPRALEEAERAGLKDLIPVPCDFRAKPLIGASQFWIPQARGFRDVQTACWEFLGRLAG